MKTFLASIIPKIKEYSHKLDNLTLLSNQHWVVINELPTSKTVYVFRSNSELLISQNGKVVKGKWEYIGNNSLLIDKGEESYLFRHGFFDETILALKVDGKNEFAFLVNESRYGEELNSVENVLSFLSKKYINLIPENQLNMLFPYNNQAIDTESEVLDKDLNLSRGQNWKFGYLNMNGGLVIDYQYDGALDFKEGFALVMKITEAQERYGFINEKGEETIDLEYEYAESFSEGLAVVRKNRKFGYINNNGVPVIDFQYDDASSFENGKAMVKIGGKKLIIDKQGNEI